MEDEAQDRTGERIDACVANARDLLRAAKLLLEEEKLPNVSFHNSVLALEEIAKANLFAIAHVARSSGGEGVNSINKRLDDHTFKLFWALWGPTFARGDVSKEKTEQLREMARGLHEQRLDAMYVSIAPGGGEAALLQVSEERARTLLGLAEVRLTMEASREWRPIDISAHEEMRWFMEATADLEKRKLIFGQKALDKLAELENMREWMVWLKAQFDQAETEGREHLQRELARVAPNIDHPGEEKWRVVVRFFSPSQSIRTGAINTWNRSRPWVRLAPVGNNRHAVDVEFTYREAMTAQALGPTSYDVARMFAAALNIGSLGFWWWNIPDQTGRFYERITDLKAPSGMGFRLSMHSGPIFEWKREALDDTVLGHVALCLGMMAKLEQSSYDSIIRPYLVGLTLLAKTDLHLSFVPQACERFAASLLHALLHFGHWDGNEGTIAAGLSSFFGTRLSTPEDVEELIELVQRARRSSAR
jgi:AbiV family abortive infection protein